MKYNGTEIALQRSQAYDLLSALFLNEPSDELLAALAQGGAPEDDSDAWAPCRTWLSEAKAAGEFDQAREDIWVDFADLFANACATSVHPFESTYLGADKLLMQPERDAVVAAYLDEAFAVDESWRLPEDHASFELAFMAALCAREAQAQPDEAARLHHVQAQFAFEHVLAWIPQLCDDVQERAKTDFYRGLAVSCAQFLDAEARYLEDEECDL